MSNDYVYDFHKNHSITQPSSKYRSKGLSGLVNLGNKCFLNSIIQCLSNTIKLTDYFISNKYKEDDPDHFNRRKEEHIILNTYVYLLVHIWEENQVLKPRSFVENLSKKFKKYYTLDQQDSHECLLFILDILHKALAYEIEIDIKGEVKTDTDALMKTSLETWKQFYEKGYSYIIETFGGMIYNKIVCNNCAELENVFEPYNNLTIDLPQENSDLKTCLSEYFCKDENITSWSCTKCKKNGCNKLQSLWSIPNYLIITLKRFTTEGKKNHSHITFPLDDLNLTEFVSKDKKDPNNYIYSLYAVNYHSGESNGGHYWSCCKNLDNNWYLFNDGHVSKFQNANDLLTKDAYILFYFRKFIKN